MKTLLLFLGFGLLSAQAQNLTLLDSPDLGGVFAHPALGSTLLVKTLRFKNNTGQALNPRSIESTNDFHVIQTSKTRAIPPGEVLEVTIEFNAKTRGTQTGEIIFTQPNGKTYRYEIQATGLAPAVSPMSWSEPAELEPE